jgi:hypothetical protein
MTDLPSNLQLPGSSASALDLPPVVQALVHPVDRTVHPTYPEGYRWAVMVGGVPPVDLDHCAQAGMCTTLREAEAMGRIVGAAVAKALHMHGIPAASAFRGLDYDPIPAAADDRPIATVVAG